jgi:hypothetical protein
MRGFALLRFALLLDNLSGYIDLHPRRLKLKSRSRHQYPKRSIMKTIKRNLKGCGQPFGCKNLWRILTLPHRYAAKYIPGRYTTLVVKDDDSYSECGPGARTVVNILEGDPRATAKGAGDQNTADAYSRKLLKYWKQWKRLLNRKIEASSGLVTDLLQKIQRDTCVDPESFQFVLCETGKLLTYHVTRNVVYERGYHGPTCVIPSPAESEADASCFESDE